jgi:hypothetical protein
MDPFVGKNYGELYAVAAQVVTALAWALICGALARQLRRSHLRWWAIGWASLALALLAVRAAMLLGGRPWWVVYLLAEWFFLLLLVMGFRQLLGHPVTTGRWLFIGLPIALVAAIVFVQVPTTFNGLFAIQAAVLAAGYAAARLQLSRAAEPLRTTGWRICCWSLTVLAAQFAIYVPLYLSIEWGAQLSWLRYSCLADAVSQGFLGFGMLVWSIEEVRDGEEAGTP